ncbi:MAG: hypothetical protein R3C03_09050 [Pirellulaceae bacterium]
MVKRYIAFLAVLCSSAFPASTNADLISFTDQGTYQSTLTTLGYSSFNEGFENEAVWGSVRTTIAGGSHTAPSITSKGITWESTVSIGEVTTSNGAARSGNWGFYSSPHVNLPTEGDGYRGTSSQTLFGVGGYIRTNTPPAGIAMWIDKGLVTEQQIDFGGANVFSSGYNFFGVINTDGFTNFQIQETEFDIDEAKYLFSDDFRFAVVSVPEPNSVWLIGIFGVVAVVTNFRRRTKTGNRN